MTHEVPAQQFSKVGTDVMYYKGVPYLILVDYMSDFIEVARLRDEAASTVIEACKEVFARHGIPQVLHSDNAPYYVSAKFSEDHKESIRDCRRPMESTARVESSPKPGFQEPS